MWGTMQILHGPFRINMWAGAWSPWNSQFPIPNSQVSPLTGMYQCVFHMYHTTLHFSYVSQYYRMHLNSMCTHSSQFCAVLAPQIVTFIYAKLALKTRAGCTSWTSVPKYWNTANFTEFTFYWSLNGLHHGGGGIVIIKPGWTPCTHISSVARASHCFFSSFWLL